MNTQNINNSNTAPVNVGDIVREGARVYNDTRRQYYTIVLWEPERDRAILDNGEELTGTYIRRWGMIREPQKPTPSPW